MVSISVNSPPSLPLSPFDIPTIRRMLEQVNFLLNVQGKQLQNTINETHKAVHGIMGQIVSFEKILKGVAPQLFYIQGAIDTLLQKNLSEKINAYAGLKKEQATSQHQLVEQILEEAYKMIQGVHRIEAMAQHTKFVALNAHIESAHAGDYGTCFSIIASEIREVSGRTESSAKEILRDLSSLKGHFQDFAHEQDKNYRSETAYLGDISDEAQLFQKEFVALSASSSSISTDMSHAEKELNDITTAIYLAAQFQDVTRQQIEHIIENLAVCQQSIQDILDYFDAPDQVELKEIDTNSILKKYTMQSERDIFEDAPAETLPSVEFF